jgi:hypothetical protein
MSSDAVLASRWTDGAKGYVLGSYKWNSFRSAWEDRLRAAVAALDGILPARNPSPPKLQRKIQRKRYSWKQTRGPVDRNPLLCLVGRRGLEPRTR